MSQPSMWQRWKAFDRRSSNRLWKFMWRYLTPFICALVIFSSMTDIGPAWRAHEGGGRRGTVTVTQEDCGRSTCSYSGNFISDDGKDHRTGVGLASGFSDLSVGIRVSAVDDGDANNVYPPGGGDDWILTTLFLGGAIGVLTVWIFFVPLGARRRGQRPSDTRVPSQGPLTRDAQAPEGGATQDFEERTPTRVVAAGPQPGSRFTLVRWREGYEIGEVDAFVAQVNAGSVTGARAQTVQFTPVRIRHGYDMGEVDDYIDRIAAQLIASGR